MLSGKGLTVVDKSIMRRTWLFRHGCRDRKKDRGRCGAALFHGWKEAALAVLLIGSMWQTTPGCQSDLLDPAVYGFFRFSHPAVIKLV